MVRESPIDCLEHHFIEGSDACIRCGESREIVEDRDQCRECGGLTVIGDLDDGTCPVCRRNTTEPVRADGGERR
jgi:hypothetical protein